MKDKASTMPAVVLTPAGGYIAFWTEIGKKPEDKPGPPPYTRFYRIINSYGNAMVERKK